MSPVLLLNPRVVVLAIGPRTSEGHRLGAQLKVIVQVPIDKFPSVVAIKSKDRKRQRFLYLGDALLHRILASIPNRPGFSPLRMHIGQSYAPAKISCHRLPAVSNRVGLNPARS